MTEKPVIHVKKVSDEKLQAQVGFTPHPGQAEVLEVYATGARTMVLCCGTRWGKSNLAAYLAVRELLKDNRRIWIVAPSYELGGKIFSYVERYIAQGFPQLQSGIVKRPAPRVNTPWGSWLEVKSAENPAGLLGEELDLVIIDEASRVKRDVWTNYIFARLAMRQGRAVIISTPFGKNWFYEEWVKADLLGHAFHFETRDNPYLPEGEWERAKEKLPTHAFRQEYEATFLEDAASVFRGIEHVIRDTLRDVDPDGFYVIGVDLAKSNDFTVLTVIDQRTNEVVHFDRFQDVDWTMQKARIVALAKRYNDARVVVDSTGLGDPISEDLRRAGVMVDDFKFTNASKQNLVEKLSIFIEQRLVWIPDVPELTGELGAFGFTRTDGGRYVYGAPTGLHDDCVMSLALAVWNLDRETHAPKPEQVQRVMARRAAPPRFR